MAIKGSTIFGKLLNSLGSQLTPLTPYPPRPLLGGPMGGGAGGARMGGYGIMSLTPKCDMFLESP